MDTKHWPFLAWLVRALFHLEPPQGTGKGLGFVRAVVLGLILALEVLPVPSAHAAGGDVDSTFMNGLLGANDQVKAVAMQSDGKVLIGGDFTQVNGVVRNYIARLNADGTLDTTFLNGLTGPSNRVHAVAVQSDGKVLIGGGFQQVNGVARNGIARLNADGSLDTTFMNGLTGTSSGWVYRVAVQSDGRVLIGGSFTQVNDVTRNGIARLNADGTLDATFLNVTLTGDAITPSYWWVRPVVVQSDGKVLIGGWFTQVNGVARTSIARLNADGTLDTTFLNVTLGGLDYMPVFAVAVQSDGKVLIGGNFTQVSGVARNGIARLNADGTLDTTFMNGASPYAMAVQSDGRVFIGGYFTQVNGVARNRIARLNADGTLDTTFLNGLTGANNYVIALTVQSDGKVLIGGAFTQVNGVARNGIARLMSPSTNADLSNLVLSSGTLDPLFASGTTTYTANVTISVTSITVTPTASDTNATIKVNGTTVASGSASGAINLNCGANTINAVVMAQDGTTTKTYTVTVTRDAIKLYLPLVIRDE